MANERCVSRKRVFETGSLRLYASAPNYISAMTKTMCHKRDLTSKDKARKVEKALKVYSIFLKTK